MKKFVSLILGVILLISCILPGMIPVSAAQQDDGSRAIAIVFDNSGSMYDNGDKAWCRATYAMEVFASMLNKGDVLMIYPMHPITVGDQKYTMENPFWVTDASQASSIREIYTPQAIGTPIESVDCAVQGLLGVNADKKYLIVITDGEAFYRNGGEMGRNETKRLLDEKFQAQVGKNMSVMYLGIGNNAVMPDTEESEYFVKKLAKDSENVLSALTDMCNRIFGRDTLPRNHINGNSVDFDISMKKLIVFVQGEDVSGVRLIGPNGNVGQQLGITSTKYGTAGCGNHTCTPDKTLQGMMVTYADCPAGTYTLEYTGIATSVEVYYEPDADLDFVFTDAAGNEVDPNNLYEGEYKVKFGMKDAKTGQMIDSDLLGNPLYNGSYFINGQEVTFTHEGYSGEVPVTLNMNDRFDSKLTVTYLSGYTITKVSQGEIEIVPRPSGALTLEISGGDDEYSLQDLERGNPYTAKVYYEGELLTGAELEKVDLRWDPDTSNVEIKKNFMDDHYDLMLFHKEGIAPEDTVCGPCTVTIYAHYAAKGSNETVAEDQMTYNVVDDSMAPKIDLYAPQDYIVISEMNSCDEIVAKFTLRGAPMTAEDFAAVEIQPDCDGLDFDIRASQEDSAYYIRLKSGSNIQPGEYKIHVDALYTDHIGRVNEMQDELTITLSTMPLVVVWVLRLLGLLLLLLLIWLILSIRRLPKRVRTVKKDCTMIFDGEDESRSTNFNAKLEKKQLTVDSKFAGVKTGIKMDVKPGKESYLRKPQHRRTAEVSSSSIRKIGSAVIQEITIGSVKYLLNEDSGKLERMPKSDKPFEVKHGTAISYSGTMMNAGVPKPFTVNTKMNFKKK